MHDAKVLLVSDPLEEYPNHAGIITALGYSVVICNSFEEGARRIGRENFDFVIVGQGGPAFEGRCVLERATQLHSQIPILVVARSLNLHNYLEAMDLGAIDYLERPEPEDVAWVLETQLKRPHDLLVGHGMN